MSALQRCWDLVGGIGLIVCGAIMLTIAALTSMVGIVFDDIILIPLGASLIVLGGNEIKKAVK